MSALKRSRVQNQFQAVCEGAETELLPSNSTDQSAGWVCGHVPRGLPALLHVEVPSLDALVVGEV